MKTCAICSKPLNDGGLIVHKDCAATREQVLAEAERRIGALQDGINHNYDAGVHNALYIIKSMQAGR